MQDSTEWDVYLLNKTQVDELRDRGKFLRTMEHSEIVKLKLLGPVPIDALAHYKARKQFFDVLVEQPWFQEKFQGISFRKLLPYIYVKNKVDGRVHAGPDLEEVFKVVKEHKEEVLVR